MAGKVDQVFDIIKEMTILELRDLNKRLQDEFGISAAPVAVAAPAAAAAPGRRLRPQRPRKRSRPSSRWS